jgi:hypothetical protein
MSASHQKQTSRRTTFNADFAVLQRPDCETQSQRDSVAQALSQMPGTQLNLTYVTVNIRNIRVPGRPSKQSAEGLTLV